MKEAEVDVLLKNKFELKTKNKWQDYNTIYIATQELTISEKKWDLLELEFLNSPRI